MSHNAEKKHPRTGYANRVLSLFGKIFATFAAVWLVLEVYNYFTPGNPIAGYRLMGLVSFAVIALIVGLSWEMVVLQRELTEAERSVSELKEQNAAQQKRLLDGREPEADPSLLEELRTAFSKRNWEEVITIGSPLSRPLWLTGRYRLRLQIGSLVEGAAAFSDRFAVQASALIDDLGWTSIALRRYDEGINYLLHGIKIAEDHGLAELACRAYRHLAGAYLKQGNYDQAVRATANSAEWLTHVSNESDKRQLEVGLVYLRARTQQLQGNHSEALPLLISAQEMFAGLSDNDRANKVYGPIGQARLALHDLAGAKDAFRRGLETARLSARRDSELVNLVGLAEVAQQAGDIGEARRLFAESSEVASHLGIVDRSIELQDRAARLAPS